MSPREASSYHRPLHAEHAAILVDAPVLPPLKTKHTDHFAITKVSHSQDKIDLLVSLQGRSSSSTTVVFEDLSKGNAREVLKILTEKREVTRRPGDPSRPLTLMLEALCYAEFHQLAAHTRTGSAPHNELARFFDAEIETFSYKELLRMVNIEGLGGGIYHLSFANHFMMNATFMRPQEYYESPKFRGKVFTTAEFRSWYSASRPHGQFSYYTDWSGFNLPDRALKPFILGAFEPLSPLEQILTETFRDMKGPLYLIGTLQGDERVTLRHEIAHALYHTNPEYRKEVERTLRSLNLTPINRGLKRMGYHHLRWRDEAHAYIGDPPADVEGLGLDSLPYQAAHEKLLGIYNKYSPVKYPG